MKLSSCLERSISFTSLCRAVIQSPCLGSHFILQGGSWWYPCTSFCPVLGYALCGLWRRTSKWHCCTSKVHQILWQGRPLHRNVEAGCFTAAVFREKGAGIVGVMMMVVSVARAVVNGCLIILPFTSSTLPSHTEWQGIGTSSSLCLITLS